jgi:hypothetical protein
MLNVSTIFAFPPHRTLLFRFVKLLKGEIPSVPGLFCKIALRGFNGVSAIDSVQVAADACVALVAPDLFGVAEVLAGGFVPVVPCSNEHKRTVFGGQGILRKLVNESPLLTILGSTRPGKSTCRFAVF